MPKKIPFWFQKYQICQLGPGQVRHHDPDRRLTRHEDPGPSPSLPKRGPRSHGWEGGGGCGAQGGKSCKPNPLFRVQVLLWVLLWHGWGQGCLGPPWGEMWALTLHVPPPQHSVQGTTLRWKISKAIWVASTTCAPRLFTCNNQYLPFPGRNPSQS